MEEHGIDPDGGWDSESEGASPQPSLPANIGKKTINRGRWLKEEVRQASDRNHEG